MTLLVPDISGLVARERMRRDARRAVDSLASFTRLMWPQIEPGVPLTWNWHLDVICEELEAVTRGECNELVVCIPPGTMKALDDETPILTTWGWKKHGELAPGDFVFAPSGKPVRVLAVTPKVYEEAFAVRFNDGTQIIAGGAHEWAVESDVMVAGRRQRVAEVVETQSLMDWQNRPHARKPRIASADPIQTPPQPLLIDPYVLGAWLGDGSSTSGHLTVGQEDIEHFTKLGRVAFTHDFPDQPNRKTYYRILVDGLQTRLRVLGLLGNKHVPDAYLNGSVEQRAALLQGMMDTDGGCDKSGGCYFSSKNKALADAVHQLVCSLGMVARIRSEQYRRCQNGEVLGPYYGVTFRAEQGTAVFRLARKQERVRPASQDRYRFRYVEAVEPVGPRVTKCIQVEGAIYLAGRSFVPTHNSILVSVMWSAWEWLAKPHVRALHISNSDRLGSRDSRRMRDIIESEPYRLCMEIAHQEHGVPMWEIAHNQAEKVHFANTENGSRLAIPSSARVTGDRGDKLVIDDPSDAQETVVGTPEQVMRRMEEVQHRYDHVWASRLNDPKHNPRVTIMQRLAPGDLAGVLLERGVRSVVLPMEYDPEHPYRNPKDPRKQAGELLFPERFDHEYVEKLKTTPGASRHYMAQYQQAPPPMGGGVFNRAWFRYYRDEGEHYTLLDKGGKPVVTTRKRDCWRVIVSDIALTAKTTADFSVIQVWDIIRNTQKGLLVDQWRGQVAAPEYEDQLRTMAARYRPQVIGIEETSVSLAIIDRLRSDNKRRSKDQYLPIRGLRPHDYGGDKVARAYAASIPMENEQVYFPVEAPYMAALEAELLTFPGGVNDDQCDSLAYATAFITDRNLWTEPKPPKLPPNSLGKILGMDDVFNPAPRNSAFTMDAR